MYRTIYHDCEAIIVTNKPGARMDRIYDETNQTFIENRPLSPFEIDGTKLFSGHTGIYPYTKEFLELDCIFKEKGITVTSLSMSHKTHSIIFAINDHNMVDNRIELDYKEPRAVTKFIEDIRKIDIPFEEKNYVSKPAANFLVGANVREKRILTRVAHDEYPVDGTNVVFPNNYSFDYYYYESPIWKIYDGTTTRIIHHKSGFIPIFGEYSSFGDVFRNVELDVSNVLKDRAVKADRAIIDILTETKHGRILFSSTRDYVAASNNNIRVWRKGDITVIIDKNDIHAFKSKYYALYNGIKLYFTPELQTGQNAIYAEVFGDRITLYGVPTPEGIFTLDAPFERIVYKKPISIFEDGVNILATHVVFPVRINFSHARIVVENDYAQTLYVDDIELLWMPKSYTSSPETIKAKFENAGITPDKYDVVSEYGLTAAM